MKNTLILIGLATMLGLTIVMFITFAAAYTSPAKAVRVHVNSYGEADIEMILLSLLLPINILSTFFAARLLAENGQESRIVAETVTSKKYRI